MRRLLFIPTLLITLSAMAQRYGEDAAFVLPDNAYYAARGEAELSNGLTGDEQERKPDRVSEVSRPVLYLFRADPARATGQAAVICPGGGYIRLAMDHEGYQVARWLARQGITAAVLKYRMPNGRAGVPQADAEAALRKLWELAPQEGYHSVGIIGFSAGGHLAGTVATAPSEKRAAPSFTVLFYPVVSGNAEIAHTDSFDRLLGGERTSEQTAAYSLENRVTAATPPTLLLLSDDDDTVPATNSVRLYAALQQHGVKAAMHIYPSGGHGWGIRDDFPYKAQWQADLLDWLGTLQTDTTKR